MGLRRLAIIGAGGLAREVAWLVRDINAREPTWEFAGYVVSDVARLGPMDEKSVLGDFTALEHDIDAVVIGIGTPSSRLKVAAEISTRFPRMGWATLIHPSVQFDRDSAILGPGVVMAAGVIGTVNLQIGAHAFVNLACTLGHEARVDAGCVLNPTVNVSGGVHLEEGVLIGTGAQVLQYLRVGRGAIVGAGAVVTKNVEPGVTVVGAPARPRS